MSGRQRAIARLARFLSLGELLEALRAGYGGYDLLRHHKQGEFHHDLVLRIADPRELEGAYLAVSTNCNGGVKEVLCFAAEPAPEALWHRRCPRGDFTPVELPRLLAEARTEHWFDPCELLGPDARSELRPEHRRRQRGGGWEPA